jgi:hypothetical protein
MIPVRSIVYEIAPSADHWTVTRDREPGAVYATVEAAFEVRLIPLTQVTLHVVS